MFLSRDRLASHSKRSLRRRTLVLLIEHLEDRTVLTNSLHGIAPGGPLLDFADFINGAGIGDIPEPGWVWVDPSQKYKSVTGKVIESFVTPTDLPAGHDSHDQNTQIMVDLDPND